MAALIEDLKTGGVPMVCCSAQKPSSKWGTRNLEAHLSKLFPAKKILRIDSESVANPNTHQPIYEFIEGVENLLIDFDPQVGKDASGESNSPACAVRKTGRLYKVSDDYYAFEDGTKWVYNSVYALEALVINKISF